MAEHLGHQAQGRRGNDRHRRQVDKQLLRPDAFEIGALGDHNGIAHGIGRGDELQVLRQVADLFRQTESSMQGMMTTMP